MRFSHPSSDKPHTYTSRHGPFVIDLFWGAAIFPCTTTDSRYREFVVTSAAGQGIAEIPEGANTADMGVVVMLRKKGQNKRPPQELTSFVKEQGSHRFLGGTGAALVPGSLIYNALALTLLIALSLLGHWVIGLALASAISALGFGLIYHQTTKMVEEARHAATVSFRANQSLKSTVIRHTPEHYEVVEHANDAPVKDTTAA